MEWISDIVLGLVRLLALVSAGVFVGSIVESSVGTARLAFLARPLIAAGRLPPDCGTAFLTALFSPRAANSMLAGAYTDHRISRRELITGAMVNLLPSSLVHIRVLAFVIIPLLGVVGLAYVGFQTAVGAAGTVTGLVAARLLAAGPPHGSRGQAQEPSGDPSRKGWRPACRQAGQRTWGVLKRVLLITVPLYGAVGVLDHTGMFDRLATRLPSAVTALVPPEGMTMIAAHISGVINAAGVAAEYQQSGAMAPVHLFLTLVIGYAVSMPVRAIRHTVPAMIGVFPVREGVCIVVITQVMRLLMATAVIVITALYLFGGANLS